MKIIFILPIFFILSIPTKAFANTNLRFEQNILKNDFLELSLDNTWELYARIDSGLNIITASLSQGFSNEILLTAEYNASIFNFLDKKLEDDVKYAQLSGAEIYNNNISYPQMDLKHMGYTIKFCRKE